MDSLMSIFNTAAEVATWMGYASAVAIPIVGSYLAWTKGPRQLQPENGTARVISARHWPKFWEKGKIVARDGAEMYLKWGASSASDIPLNTFRVDVARKGKDQALTLDDKVKAEVAAEFYVRVDSSSPASIIQAMESLGGDIDERKITEYCTPKFDAALRQAAAKMQIEQIQTEREQFRTTVKDALDSLKDDGLILVDVALRQLNQSPVEDFDPNNYFDAQGLEKVTKIVEQSKKIINDTKEEATTQIKTRNKDEEIRRLTIAEEQKKATLAQAERVRQLEAEQAKRVAEIEAENTKMANLAHIKAEEETESRRIAMQQQVGVAEEQKQQALKVANEARLKAEQEAAIGRQKAVDLAERDKQIALHAKAQEEADAEKAANEKKAEAVEAAEAVKTAQQVAEAERGKRVEVIKAQQEAEKATAAEKIAADARVYVAEQAAKAAKTEATGVADALKIESEADAAAAKLRAEAAYEEEFKRLKALADGKAADADATRASNEAQNALSDEARKHLADLARIQVTPEVVGKVMALATAIKSFNVVSMDGVSLPGMGGGTSGPGIPATGGGSGNVVDQIIEGFMKVAVTKPMMEKLMQGFGGDPGIAAMLPDIATVTGGPANDDPKHRPVVPAAPAPTPLASGPGVA